MAQVITGRPFIAEAQIHLQDNVRVSCGEQRDTGTASSLNISLFTYTSYCTIVKGKGKAVPLQAWRGPVGSRKLRLPDFVTTAQDGGKFVSLKHRPLFTPRKCSWYSFLLKAESTPGP